jgi:hypothetical protein
MHLLSCATLATTSKARIANKWREKRTDECCEIRFTQKRFKCFKRLIGQPVNVAHTWAGSNHFKRIMNKQN